ncbi:hypothetical protein ACFOOP_06690 [Marinicaulis aureus]|uniref:Lipoprotein n=1 Tax=Hyphococcus aureus TaxID=2666033 RepID=A0ABW1KRR1_9PROT
MRSLSFFRFSFALAAMLTLGGCLVSDVPVLDARTGKARPFSDGDYLACPLKDGEIEAGDECDRLTARKLKDGGYSFINPEEDDDPAFLRFRRIGRGGYAVQSSESDDFVYYYGAKRDGGMLLVLMNCPDLPAELRARLIASGDLEPDDEKFSVCKVKTLRGLTEAAKAYHRGDVAEIVDAAILIAPAPPLEETE